MSEIALRCQSLNREFTRTTRDPGIAAAVRSFFAPKRVTKKAVSELSFALKRGSITGLVGANGAGKTTFLKMAAGLLHPSSGTIEVLGHKPFERRPDFLKKIGMVMGQKSQLWIDIPASETFELLGAVYRMPAEAHRARVKELAELFGATEQLGVQVRRLSLGERMKLEIMAALLHEPEVLFLDEPTIGLDVVAKARLRELIRDYNRRKGTTIVLSSHDMDDIAEVCDRLLIVSKGQLKFDGTVSEIANLKSHVLELIEEKA
jgi:ABC-2 type transport system ATP-binding protein